MHGNWQYGIRRVPEYGNRWDTWEHPCRPIKFLYPAWTMLIKRPLSYYVSVALRQLFVELRLQKKRLARECLRHEERRLWSKLWYCKQRCLKVGGLFSGWSKKLPSVCLLQWQPMYTDVFPTAPMQDVLSSRAKQWEERELQEKESLVDAP